jgi:2-polyprenyl-3-methyl-5-hydroxy-6-metoxy-1,4-benzoquinol methylase
MFACDAQESQTMRQHAGVQDYPCDLCGADEPIEVPHCRLYTGGQVVHICGACGFVYVRTRRSSEEIARVWAQEIYGAVYTAVRNPAVMARQTFVAEFLASNTDIEGSTVCDVGAGEGLFLKYLQEHYRVSAFGIEPSTSNSARLHKLGIESFDGTIEQFLASPAARAYRADVVTVMWTLENCFSCIDMLKGAAALVEVGGKVLVATGSRILVPFKKPLFQYFSHTPADTHCFRFSANALQTALALAGLRTVATNRYIDNDILCVLAEKTEPAATLQPIKDHPLEVVSFFERWHAESVHYVRDWAR